MINRWKLFRENSRWFAVMGLVRWSPLLLLINQRREQLRTGFAPTPSSSSPCIYIFRVSESVQPTYESLCHGMQWVRNIQSIVIVSENGNTVLWLLNCLWRRQKDFYSYRFLADTDADINYSVIVIQNIWVCVKLFVANKLIRRDLALLLRCSAYISSPDIPFFKTIVKFLLCLYGFF